MSNETFSIETRQSPPLVRRLTELARLPSWFDLSLQENGQRQFQPGAGEIFRDFQSNLHPNTVNFAHMVLTTYNKAKQLLYVSYIGKVQASDLRKNREEAETLLVELSPGFRLLADLSLLESINPDCAMEIGQLMECIDQRGVSLVVRVIPDPQKDIGLNILSLFHYRHRPKLITCTNLTAAAQELSL